MGFYGRRASAHFTDADLVLSTPYDEDFVREIKRQIPPEARLWDNDSKKWYIAPEYIELGGELMLRYHDTDIMDYVDMDEFNITPVEGKFLLEYLTVCKDNGGVDQVAYGVSPTVMVNTSGYTTFRNISIAADLITNGAKNINAMNKMWKVLMYRGALKDWFGGGEGSDYNPSNHYEALLIDVNKVSPESIDQSTIKSAWRRIARQLHPDVNKEPDAVESFMRAKNAYDVLSDDKLKIGYDVGLQFETQIKDDSGTQIDIQIDQQGMRSSDTTPLAKTYRSPLRNGFVNAIGFGSCGRFRVLKITEWEDVQRVNMISGEIEYLTSFWPEQGYSYVTRWVGESEYQSHVNS